MARIRVSRTMKVEPEVLWAAVEDISSHVLWMAGAESITFTSDQRTGAGTTTSASPGSVRSPRWTAWR
ncbi:MAG: hypothetical protein R2716_07960 [Microthrixaceae bacterium]